MSRRFGSILQLASICLLTASAAHATTATQRQMYTEVLQEDIEPAVIAQNRSGVTYTTTVFMHFSNTFNDPAQFYYSSFNSSGQTRANALGIPSGYTRVSDPVLAKNTTSSHGANRIWLAGVAIDASSNTRLAYWYSDDGGFTWSAPSTIITGDLVDKPAIAVSADPSSPGYVYIAYVSVSSLSNPVYQIRLVVSPDGGASWQGPYDVSIAPSSADHSPQVVVDPSTGTIYALWSHGAYLNGQIQMASAPRWTAAWSLVRRNFADLTPLTTGPLYGWYYDPILYLGAVQLRNYTNPVVRLDSANRRLSVVWHEQVLGNPDLSPTRMAAYSLANSTWISPKTVSQHASGHSVKPSMDLDPATGNYMVTYYYFPAGSSAYSLYARYVDASGGGLAAEVKIGPNYTAAQCGSDIFDVSSYTADSKYGKGLRSLGEYHDVSFANGKWYSAAIGVVPCPNNCVVCTGNPFVWTITQP